MYITLQAVAALLPTRQMPAHLLYTASSNDLQLLIKEHSIDLASYNFAGLMMDSFKKKIRFNINAAEPEISSLLFHTFVKPWHLHYPKYN